MRRLREAVQFYGSMNAAATIDANLKRQFAEACAFLATALAKNKTPKSVAEASESYQRSLGLWRDLQNSGVLRYSDASQPEEIARQLTRLREAPNN